MKSRGEDNTKAKLTAAAVVEIRRRHQLDDEPLLLLAFGFGVSATTIGGIVTGRFWKHVGGPTRENLRPHRQNGHSEGLCPKDGYPLQHAIERGGRVVEWCEACDRRHAGRCMDCGAPVLRRRWRCEPHRIAHWRGATRDFQERNREAINRRQTQLRKLWSQERHRHHCEVKKAWRRNNPRKVLGQRRRARLKGNGGWRTHEQYVAYHAAYREAHRERRRELAREQYYREHPERPNLACVVCGADVDWSPGHGRPRTMCAHHYPIVYAPNGLARRTA